MENDMAFFLNIFRNIGKARNTINAVERGCSVVKVGIIGIDIAGFSRIYYLAFGIFKRRT